MKHDWEDIGGTRERPGEYRKCRNCGAIQQGDNVQNWGRVVGHSWYPPAGRCKRLSWKAATHGRQESQCGEYFVYRGAAYSNPWFACHRSDKTPINKRGSETRSLAKEICEFDFRTSRKAREHLGFL